MFKTRLISGIVLVAAALVTIISGGYVLFFTCLALSIIGAGEFYLAVKLRKPGVTFGLLDSASYLCIVIFYACLVFFDSSLSAAGIAAAFLILMFIFVFTFPNTEPNDIFKAFFGFMYTGVMISFIYQTRMLDGGFFHVWLIFLSAWGCDTCAYCAGMLLGKHKMTPLLSPKKTIEGAIGGVLGAALLGVIYALITSGPIVQYLIICAVAAIISMVGDLAASAIKRKEEIKDYGNLIPGHGGILDRFDSIIFTAPVIYFLCRILMIG